MVPAAPKELESAPVKDFTAHAFGMVVDNSVYVICYGDYAPSIHLDTDAELLANRDNFLKGLNGTAGATTQFRPSRRKAKGRGPDHPRPRARSRTEGADRAGG